MKAESLEFGFATDNQLINYVAGNGMKRNSECFGIVRASVNLCSLFPTGTVINGYSYSIHLLFKKFRGEAQL